MPAKKKDRWDGFIAQGDSIELLKKMDTANKRAHILLNGPPGTGKTTLAKIVSRGNLVACVGSSLRSADKTATMVMAAVDQGIDTFFIDEVHSAKLNALEVLYPVMEEQIVYMGGKPEPAKMWVIAATTDGGKLPKPFVDRFGIEVRLRLYEQEEMHKIISDMSKKFKITLSEPIIDDIATRSLGVPRTARQIINRLADFSNNYNNLEEYENIVRMIGIQPDGLTSTETTVLNTIWKSFARGPVGVSTLAHATQIDEQQLTKYVEPILIRLGYLTIEKSGRKLTSKGLARVVAYS